MGAYYIVTDLDVRARFDMAELHAELTAAGLHGSVSEQRGMWRRGYSSSKNCCRNPARAIKELLEIIEALSPKGREQWNRCTTRRFDVGFQCFEDRFVSRWQVSPALQRRIAAVKGNLVITIYRNDNPSDDE